MRLVPRATTRPSRCAVLPYIGQTHAEGFIDTGSEMIGGRDNHVYVSVVAAKEMARMIGWVPPGEHKQALKRLAEAEDQLAQAQEQISVLERKFDAIDVLASAGFQARKKAGRPPKEVAA